MVVEGEVWLQVDVRCEGGDAVEVEGVWRLAKCLLDLRGQVAEKQCPLLHLECPKLLLPKNSAETKTPSYMNMSFSTC